MHSQVLEALSDVGDVVTLHSRLQRRNVMRDESRDDLDSLELETGKRPVSPLSVVALKLDAFHPTAQT